MTENDNLLDDKHGLIDTDGYEKKGPYVSAADVDWDRWDELVEKSEYEPGTVPVTLRYLSNLVDMVEEHTVGEEVWLHTHPELPLVVGTEAGKHFALPPRKLTPPIHDRLVAEYEDTSSDGEKDTCGYTVTEDDVEYMEFASDVDIMDNVTEVEMTFDPSTTNYEWNPTFYDEEDDDDDRRHCPYCGAFGAEPTDNYCTACGEQLQEAFYESD